MSKRSVHWFFAACLVVPAHTWAGNPPGPPLRDHAWGTHGNGIAYFAFDAGGGQGDYGSTALVLPDGRLLMAGIAQLADGPGGGQRFDVALVRIRPADGSPDPDFGGGTGRIMLGVPVANGQVDLARRADGRLLFTSRPTTATVMIGQLDEGGSFDPAFDLDGRRQIGASAFLDSADQLYEAHVQPLPDGKSLLMVSAIRTIAPVRQCIGVMRLNADGSTDTGFGAGTGRVCHSPVNKGIAAAAGATLRVLGDGRILIVGASLHSGGSSTDITLLSLLPDGAFDPGFGEDGWLFVPFDQGGQLSDAGLTLELDDSGRIVIAGYADDEPEDVIAVARLRADGSLDPDFGTQGRVVIDFSEVSPGLNASTHSLVLLPDGRMIIGGQNGYTGLMAMLTPGGTLDPGFGEGGLFVQSTFSDPSQEQMFTNRVLVDGDYLYLVGNSSSPTNSSNVDFATERLVLPLFQDGFESASDPSSR